MKMNAMYFTAKIVLLFIAVILFSADHLRAQTKDQKSSDLQNAYDQLAAKDKELFDAIFNSCDVDKLKTLLTADFEFYHDKFGQIADSADKFTTDIKAMCERQKQGTDYRARRELVAGSLKVYLLNNYGAIQMGEHRFYKLTPGKPAESVESAKFTHLWKNENGAWKLARVLSYDHQDLRANKPTNTKLKATK